MVITHQSIGGCPFIQPPIRSARQFLTAVWHTNYYTYLPVPSRNGRSRFERSDAYILYQRRFLYGFVQICLDVSRPSYDGACSNFKIPSYMPNMMAALGTVLRRCGVRPPYMAAMPSSFHISLKHWIRPVYLGCPSSIGA